MTDSESGYPTKRLSLWALAAWSLFVWGGRVRNIVNDDSLVGAARSWRLGLAGSFVVLGIVLVIALLLERRSGASYAVVFAGWVLAVYGIVVWAIRGLDIVLGDHEFGFKVVHAVLATVTIGLGLWAIQSLRRSKLGGLAYFLPGR